MPPSKLTRAQLIKLATEIQNAQDRGEDYSELLNQFQANVPMPNVAELFDGDQGPPYIVEYALKWREPLPELSKDELLELVRKLYSGKGRESEQNYLIQVFIANCKHPAKTDLLACPDEYFDGNMSPSPEEVVDKAWEES